MASFNYLWKNRIKSSFLSKQYFIRWAKRILTFKALIMNNNRRNKLFKLGANIAKTAEIGFVKIDGNKGNLSVGEFSFIGRVEIALHEKVDIGNFVCINDLVLLLFIYYIKRTIYFLTVCVVYFLLY